MNVISYAAVFFIFAAAGYIIWRGYKRRKIFFEDLISFCNHLLVEISFSKNTVSRIIENYSSNYSREFRTTLLKYQDLLHRKKDVTHGNIDISVWRGLKKSARVPVVDFFTELGRHSSSEESEKIQNKKLIFDKLYEQATNSLKRDASIYLKLFILIGVAAVILML